MKQHYDRIIALANELKGGLPLVFEQNDEGYPLATLDGYSMGIDLDIAPENTIAPGWSRNGRPARLRLSFGDFGSRVSLAQRANGEFFYERAAEYLVDRARMILLRRVEATALEANQPAVNRLKAKHNLSEYSSVIAATTDLGTLRVRVTIDQRLPADEADALLAKLKGLI